MQHRPPPPPVLLPPVGGRPLHSTHIAVSLHCFTPLLAGYAGRFIRSVLLQRVFRYTPSPPRQAAAHTHPPGRYRKIHDREGGRFPSDYGCLSDDDAPSDYGFSADLRGFYGCTSDGRPSDRSDDKKPVRRVENALISLINHKSYLHPYFTKCKQFDAFYLHFARLHPYAPHLLRIW